jgi:perosamine synthetase
MRESGGRQSISDMFRLAKPYIPEAAIFRVVDILKSGNLVQGHHVREFEMALEGYLSIKHAVVCSSGTAALHLALLAADIKEGDEVICPAFTFPATANVIERSGAKTVLVDITPDDFCLDPSKTEEAITDSTKAVVVVHEFGQSADMEGILTLTDKFGLRIIEDAACALGTEYHERKAGTFGLMGCFSFHPRKAITTGEGGVVVTDDEALADRLRALRNHGMDTDGGHQDFIYAGLNYRMTEFQAVLGLAQLAEIDYIIGRRIEQATRYDRALSTIDRIKTPAVFDRRKAVYQTYHLLFADTIDRDRLMVSMKAAGVETNIGAQSLNCLTYYQRKYGHRPDDFPNAQKAYRRGLALPIGLHLTDDDIDRIAMTLTDILETI